MCFATPSPDMTNRLPKHKVSGRVRAKTGRPSNGEPERIRTIAWFHAVAISLTEHRPGTIGRRMQNEANARSLEVNHDTSKRWNRYAKGEETPSVQTLRFVNEVAPGTAEAYLHGPSDLWTALWGERDLHLHEEDVTALFSADPEDVDMTWLSRAVIAWRHRAALIRFGAFDHLVDGLYEAIFFGLHQQRVKLDLSRLGVWDLVCKAIMDAEQLNLLRDPRKHQELEAVGRHFSENPIQFYLSNPVGFAAVAIAENSAELDQ